MATGGSRAVTHAVTAHINTLNKVEYTDKNCKRCQSKCCEYKIELV